jgi:4'-phosphopantetheinyl transferase
MDEVRLHESFRETSPGAATLRRDEVHVWAVPMAGDGERFAAWLSPAEQDRAQRFRFADHGRRYTIAHGALRTILGGYVGADPAALQFATGARGKPALVGAGMPQFNLSHSAQLAMVAVATTPVGIDVEKVRYLERLRDIAQRQFSTAEFAALGALPETEQLPAFYRCWTRKEAYVKALGLGLAALDVFDVDIGERARLLALRDGQDVQRWSMFDVSPAADYTGGLAVYGREASVRRFALLDL